MHLYLGIPMINWRENQKKSSVAYSRTVEAVFFSWLEMQISLCKTVVGFVWLGFSWLYLFCALIFKRLNLMSCMWKQISVPISFCSLVKKKYVLNEDIMCLISFEYIMRKMQTKKWSCFCRLKGNQLMST